MQKAGSRRVGWFPNPHHLLAAAITASISSKKKTMDHTPMAPKRRCQTFENKKDVLRAELKKKKGRISISQNRQRGGMNHVSSTRRGDNAGRGTRAKRIRIPGSGFQKAVRQRKVDVAVSSASRGLRLKQTIGRWSAAVIFCRFPLSSPGLRDVATRCKENSAQGGRAFYSSRHGAM